jgi:hypothetical protein
MKKVLIALGVVILAIASYLIGQNQTTNSDVSATQVLPSATPEVTQAEVDMTAPADPQIALAWNALMDPTGEYAAFAMYNAVIEKFGNVEPYISIRDAEQNHINALTRQLEWAGIAVPANPYVGKVAAPATLQEAATAWAQGEIDNVLLYDKLLAEATDANLVRVFNNLRRASNDIHLPMFEAAAANGGTLTPEQMIQYHAGSM